MDSDCASSRAKDNRAVAQIDSPEELANWLEDRPADWGALIACRTALRASPYCGQLTRRQETDSLLILLVTRNCAISWLACRYAAKEVSVGTGSAYSPTDIGGYSASVRAAAIASDAAYSAVYPTKGADAAVKAAANAANASGAPDATVWRAITADCNWLEELAVSSGSARELAGSALWSSSRPDGWTGQWQRYQEVLLADDSGYTVWNDWFERRIRGEDSSFDIPGDNDHAEDEAIAGKLLAATHEDFWDKGAAHVNATLQRWLDEARERAAVNLRDDGLPKQDPAATIYGVNEVGQLDRLPPGDQIHLRDDPDQRRAYRDLRDAALELASLGQQLGNRLHSATDRFVGSLPGRFEDAEAYLVWRDGNKLRRIYRMHQAVAGQNEFDEARLDSVAAEELAGLLDLLNNFAFADDGLRAMDERSLAPQERLAAADEAALGRPLDEAILKAEDMRTEAVADDIRAEQADALLPQSDPYAAQVLAQENLTRRNRIAAILVGAAKWLGQEAASSGKNVRDGFEKELGKRGAQLLFAAGIVQWAITNSAALAEFARTVFNSPALLKLIEQIGRLAGA